MTEYVRDPFSFRGRVEMRPFASEVLRENRAGDPHEREVPVYLPPGWDSGARFPVLFLLIGFTGRGQMYADTSNPWKPGLIARYDRAVAAGELPAAIVVAPDCFTKVGGSQYVDSELLGPYAEYVVRELTAWVDAHYPTRPGRRAVAGKSSGGFGALHLAMRHPGVFPVVASISGDCGFEGCHAPAFWAALRVLRNHAGDPWSFLEEYAKKPSPSVEDFETLNTIAMSACYSPNLASRHGFDLPFDPETGARREDVWRRWLEFDPLYACERYADALRKLELLHVECGLNDEFNIQWGTRQLSHKLRSLGVPHHHEEHDGGHRNIDERYLKLLPALIAKLA